MIAYEQPVITCTGMHRRFGRAVCTSDGKRVQCHRCSATFTPADWKNCGIAYALVDGMAMFYDGYRRFTEDVDDAG